MDYKVRIKSNLRNRNRDEVTYWCTEMFGEKDEKWGLTSNYVEDFSSDFDALFDEVSDSWQYLIRWGGVVLESPPEEKPSTFNKFFDEV